MENITLIRHPSYDKTPHFNVNYDTGLINRLDGSDSLVLLKNEQELTTYTFQIPRFYNESSLDILRNLYQIEVETYGYFGDITSACLTLCRYCDRFWRGAFLERPLCK